MAEANNWWEAAPMASGDQGASQSASEGNWWESAPVANDGAKAEDDEWERANLLPLARNTETGEKSLAVPGFLMDIADAISLPSRVYSGETQIFGPDGNVTDEVIEGSLDLAGIATPATPASRMGKAAASAAKPLKEGQKVAAAGERLGVELPRAVTSDSVSMQQAGKIASNVPVGGTPLRKASEKAINQLDDAAGRVQSGYGRGNAQIAGEAVRGGVDDLATRQIPDQLNKLYGAVDNLIDPAVKTPLASTSRVASEILSKREAAAIAAESPAIRQIQEAISKPDGLTYQGIKNLRTYLGEMLKKPNLLPAGTSETELRQIYGSLSDDLRAAVSNAGGPKALRAFEVANRAKSATATRVAALEKVLGTSSDEAIAAKIKAMAGSTGRADIKNLNRVRMAAGKQAWDELSSAVIASLGRDAEGKFSPDRFVTAWGKLSKEGRKALFASTGKEGLAKSLDDIAAVSSRFKHLQQFANPSGTGQTILGGAAASAAIWEPVTVLTTVAGARLASKFLASPKSAKSVAQWAKAYQVAVSKPSTTANSILRQRAGALSVVIANEWGTPEAAAQIQKQLMSESSATGSQDDAAQSTRTATGPRPGVPSNLTPNDIASPIAPDLISEGKALLGG